MSESSTPALHFAPRSGWMNDPNGLIYFEGEWHLFYQYLPPGKKLKHWGHAVSRDLMQWEHLPVALEPDELGEIFSGSCVADIHNTSGLLPDGGLVAIFTHHKEGLVSPQVQSLAYSNDRGRTWQKFSGNPVLRKDIPDFRDPKVFWHDAVSEWVMIVAAGDHAEIYRSANLRDWRFMSEAGRGLSSLVWECPDLFPLRDENGEEKWFLTASFLGRGNFQGGVGPCEQWYLAGQFDGTTFTTESGLCRLSQGPDDYAAVTFTNAPHDRRILLGWLNHWGYSWHSGQMTLPRELSWRDGGLVQTPAVAVTCPDVSLLTSPATTPWKIQAPEVPSWKLEVRKGDDLVFSISREDFAGRWIFQRGTAAFPRDWAGRKTGLEAAFTKQHEAPIEATAAGPTQVIVDHHSVEIFCGGGRAYFAAQIFPPDEGEWRIDFLPR